MLCALIAASLFPTQQRLPFPGAVRVGIAQRRVIAVSESGAGKVLPDGPSFAAGHHPSSLAIADLNGDGNPDLVIANHEEKYVTVLLGPSFANPVQVPVDVRPHAHFAAVADLDGDGKPDLILNDMAGKRVLVMWGKGDGTFTTPTAGATGSKGYAYIDVAVSGPRLFVPTWPQPQLAVLRVRGRSLEPEARLELPNPSFYAVALGEDVAVATYSGSIADPSRDGIVLLHDGDVGSYRAGPAPTSLAAAGDELAVCNLGGGVTIFVNKNHQLHEEVRLPADHPQGIALGDLDGDGKADLAVAAQDEVLIFLTH